MHELIMEYSPLIDVLWHFIMGIILLSAAMGWITIGKKEIHNHTHHHYYYDDGDDIEEEEIEPAPTPYKAKVPEILN